MNCEALETMAARWISEADGVLITAGTGMGIDSGLPDFRGATGFWRAYLALGAKGVTFRDIANGMAFRVDPKRAWGFYGHRLSYTGTPCLTLVLTFLKDGRKPNRAERSSLQAMWTASFGRRASANSRSWSATARSTIYSALQLAPTISGRLTASIRTLMSGAACFDLRCRPARAAERLPDQIS
ncbi:hypothetical protein J2776_000852 [Paraburkholderia caledonica]|uniref:Deacetylase sirtuin-type domain-containing protein n=1 Tax=Paraburkholderia caledonica TaxID=134536 RepID=A0ABU1KTA2_9BURK|nr:hypothetical protein [Paraburkholderia caledonica]